MQPESSLLSGILKTNRRVGSVAGTDPATLPPPPIHALSGKKTVQSESEVDHIIRGCCCFLGSCLPPGEAFIVHKRPRTGIVFTLDNKYLKSIAVQDRSPFYCVCFVFMEQRWESPSPQSLLTSVLQTRFRLYRTLQPCFLLFL